MIVLDGSTKSLELVLAGAITSNQLPFVASYLDNTASGETPIENDGATNNTTAVTVVAAPSGGSLRRVTFVSVFNRDTAAATVTVQLNNNGTGRILCKVTLAVGSTLTYTDDEGFRTTGANGAVIVGSATASGVPDVQVFTSSGTWTKASGVTVVRVIAVAGGGGGGSGRKGAASTIRNGGGGGGGGGRSDVMFKASLLGSTESVTVGSGGAGGAAQTTNSTDGNAGTAGGDSSFGSWLLVTGGSAGGSGKGTASNNSGGSGGFGQDWGGSGNRSTTTSSPTADIRSGSGNCTSYAAGAGGGGGGGIQDTNAYFTAGTAGSDNGSAPRAGGNCVAGNRSGGAAGTDGSSAGGAGSSATANDGTGGAGGGGGGANLSGNAFAGGGGGSYGGGGGRRGWGRFDGEFRRWRRRRERDCDRGELVETRRSGPSMISSDEFRTYLAQDLTSDTKFIAEWLPQLSATVEHRPTANDAWKRPYSITGRTYAGFAETLANTLRWYKTHKMVKFEQPGWQLDQTVIDIVRGHATQVIGAAVNSAEGSPEAIAYLREYNPDVLARYTAIDIRFQQLTGRHIQTVLDFGSGVGRQAWYWGRTDTLLYSVDVTESLYLLQNRMYQTLFGERFVEYLADPRAFTTAARPGTVAHLPAWQMSLVPDRSVDLVIAVQVLQEISLPALRETLRSFRALRRFEYSPRALRTRPQPHEIRGRLADPTLRPRGVSWAACAGPALGMGGLLGGCHARALIHSETAPGRAW